MIDSPMIKEFDQLGHKVVTKNDVVSVRCFHFDVVGVDHCCLPQMSSYWNLDQDIISILTAR
jgi:hypothetical protein